MILLLNKFTINGILHRYWQIHLFFFLPTGIVTITSVCVSRLSEHGTASGKPDFYES